MNKLRVFYNLLNSRLITDSMIEYHIEHSDSLKAKWKDESEFVRYLKAFLIDKFNEVPDEIKDHLINELRDGIVNTYLVETFVEIIRGEQANVNEYIDGITLGDFSDLLVYKDDEIFKRLSSNNEWIRGLTKENNNFISILELENGNYFLPGNYRLSKDEINTIKCSKMLAPIIGMVHSKYDEMCYDENGVSEERTICNYDVIKEETIKSLVPHTDKNNPDIEILFNDGTIVNYYKGDIRILPFNFKQLVEYIKLMFVYNYYNGSNNPLLAFYLETEDGVSLDTDFDDMNLEEIEILLGYAISMATDVVRSLSQRYSERMIEQSKEKVAHLLKLANKYKL